MGSSGRTIDPEDEAVTGPDNPESGRRGSTTADSPEPYIRHGLVAFVPVIRSRLSFAILVRRAILELLHESKKAERDLVIAVQLPPSLDEIVGLAIDQLPKVSLIAVESRPREHKEIIPITPCDGLVEAIRTAREENLSLRYIDQEIVPGDLVHRHCLGGNDWPDDVLEVGPEQYRKDLGAELNRPPLRLEPVDTLREIHMAQVIRRLCTQYQPPNVVVVCDVTHVQPLRELLRKPQLQPEVGSSATGELSVHRMNPSLPVLLGYLDDIPQLVEVYDDLRRKEPQLTKETLLGTSLAEFGDRFPEFGQPEDIRSWTKWCHYPGGARGRRFSNLDEIISATVSATADRRGRDLARALRCHLLKYGQQVNVDRVGQLISPRTPRRTSTGHASATQCFGSMRSIHYLHRYLRKAEFCFPLAKHC